MHTLAEQGPRRLPQSTAPTRSCKSLGPGFRRDDGREDCAMLPIPSSRRKPDKREARRTTEGRARRGERSESPSDSLLTQRPSSQPADKIRIQITPIRIDVLDQPQLPCPRPVFQGFLSRNGRCHGLVRLEPDQPMHAIAAGEACDEIVAVLPCTTRKIRGHTDVQRAVAATCEHVDAGFADTHGVRVRAGKVACKETRSRWVPAFAGMTVSWRFRSKGNLSASCPLQHARTVRTALSAYVPTWCKPSHARHPGKSGQARSAQNDRRSAPEG